MRLDSPIAITTYAKLLISGEHSVLRGAPAVGLPLPLPFHLTFSPHTATKESATPLFSADDTRMLAEYPHFIEEITRNVDDATDGSGGRIRIKSDIPVGVGLGSSATLCVACAELLFRLRNGRPGISQRMREDARNQIWRDAHRLECYFHDTPSGVDSALVSIAAPLIFWHQATGSEQSRVIPDPAAHYRLQQLTDQLSITLAMIVLPRNGTTTKKMIATVRDVRNQNHMHDFCNESAHFAQQCAALSTARTITSLASLSSSIRSLHILQQKLGIATAETDAFIHYAIQCGAAAGKVSGAGGGGVVFVLFHAQDALSSALPQLTHFCHQHYKRDYFLFSGVWCKGKWQRFENCAPSVE